MTEKQEYSLREDFSATLVAPYEVGPFKDLAPALKGGAALDLRSFKRIAALAKSSPENKLSLCLQLCLNYEGKSLKVHSAAARYITRAIEEKFLNDPEKGERFGRFVLNYLHGGREEVNIYMTEVVASWIATKAFIARASAHRDPAGPAPEK